MQQDQEQDQHPNIVFLTEIMATRARNEVEYVILRALRIGSEKNIPGMNVTLIPPNMNGFVRLEKLCVKD